ncbi:hypothetical protein ESOMN_v1c05970 [Williamsoniiplasma somnilux]|uniref:Uncharacterized protein n=1 Tax=Williamsoniiplasma somnilux TaxID=215578 RepID=A0A2K8NYT7_9MOLU|nr:hypothetical protein [Williamsoniiplasma somnilux]ATZ18979.1 hypothetical protein ESOMN_v1c05970 [Williamsoniiplasma somnilux]
MTKKNIDINQIDENNGYLLFENIFDHDENKFFIFKEILFNEKIKNKILENIDYYSIVEYQEKYFEAISFKGSADIKLLRSIFLTISSEGWNLKESLNKINDLFSKLNKALDLKTLRGIFAEIYSVLNLDCKIKDYPNSIYDMERNGDDIEIKSFSKVEKNIQVSYQQLTNNSNAVFYLIEIIENNLEGKTVYEMYNNLSISERLKFKKFEEEIKNNKMKFIVGQIKETTAEKLAEGLVMPKTATDAKFTFKV